jgi:Dihydroorotate dehydrogenase
LVINISSPNTPGLRNLQKSEPIRRLLKAAIEKRDELGNKPPLLVKIAPDLSLDEMKDIASAVVENNVDGILVTNTSNQRPASLISDKRNETGGLSGLPIRDLSTECIRKMYELTEGKVFLVGIGGVGSGHDVYEKLKAGASVVQIYSRMVYEGPGLVSRIRKELSELMKENGQSRIEDVVGLDHEEIYWRKRLDRFEVVRNNRETKE